MDPNIGTVFGLSSPVVPVDGGLARYIRAIARFPMLGSEQEYLLAKRWREHGDVGAAHTLVTSHLRLVAKIAMRYRGYGLPVADLVSEGNTGLMRAVEKFEPERGVRLSTYAIWWIKAAIIEYVLRSWSLVKMGGISSQRKLFFTLRRLKGQLGILDNGDLDPEQSAGLARRLGVSERDLIAMNRRMSARDASLNAPILDESGAAEFQDTLVDDRASPEAQAADNEERRRHCGLLKRALEGLPARERHILTERRLRDDPATLKELGLRYGISRERVRQLEVRAFQKVRHEFANAAVAA